MGYRDVYPHSTSMIREKIDIVLYIKLVLKLDTTSTKTYYKRATNYKGILGIRKETRIRLLSLQIVSDG